MMMMKYKQANKHNKTALTAVLEHRQYEESGAWNMKPLLEAPKRVSFSVVSTENNKEDGASSIGSSCSMDLSSLVPPSLLQSPIPTIQGVPTCPPASKTKLPSDIFFAPIINAKRRLSFEEAASLTPREQVMTDRVALISPRLTPELASCSSSHDDDSVPTMLSCESQDDTSARVSKKYRLEDLPPSLFIPLTTDQEAASLLMTLRLSDEEVDFGSKKRPVYVNNTVTPVVGNRRIYADGTSSPVAPAPLSPPRNLSSLEPRKKRMKRSTKTVTTKKTICKAHAPRAGTTSTRRATRAESRAMAAFAPRCSPTRKASTTATAAASITTMPMRLAMPNDAKELNSLHCFVRSELLEFFVMDTPARGGVRPSSRYVPPKNLPQSGAPTHGGRVGFRCSHCAHLSRQDRKEEATPSSSSMASFFPKSLKDLYRSVCTWQRIHFKSCPHVPREMSERYHYLKDTDRTRGRKSHWMDSAYELGMRDFDENRGGIIWDPTDTFSIREDDTVTAMEVDL